MRKKKSSGPVDVMIESLNKELGIGVAGYVGNITRKLTLIPTGVTALDLVIGGIPEGRFTQVFGPESSCKTTLCLQIIRQFQKLYAGKEPLAAFIDFEHSAEREYMQVHGVDLSKLVLIEPSCGEEGITAMEKIIQYKDGPVLLVGDSLAAITPEQEVEEDITKQTMGLQARLVNKMFRKLTARMRQNLYDDSRPQITVVFINQVREKIGVAFGDPETTPGGRGKEFFWSLNIKLFTSAGRKIIEKREGKKGTRKVRVGQEFDFKVYKSKIGPFAWEEGTFSMMTRDTKDYKAGEFNNDEVLMKAAQFYGMDVPAKLPFFRRKIWNVPSLRNKLMREVMKAQHGAGRMIKFDETEPGTAYKPVKKGSEVGEKIRIQVGRKTPTGKRKRPVLQIKA